MNTASPYDNITVNCLSEPETIIIKRKIQGHYPVTLMVYDGNSIESMTKMDAEKLFAPTKEPINKPLRIRVIVETNFTRYTPNRLVLAHLIANFVNPHNKRLGFPEVEVEYTLENS